MNIEVLKTTFLEYTLTQAYVNLTIPFGHYINLLKNKWLYEAKYSLENALLLIHCAIVKSNGGAVLRKSFEKLRELPDHLKVYTGHAYGDKDVSTLGEEKGNA